MDTIDRYGKKVIEGSAEDIITILDKIRENRVGKIHGDVIEATSLRLESILRMERNFALARDRSGKKS